MSQKQSSKQVDSHMPYTMNMEQPDNHKILFIYNAASGLGNALLDFGKKYVQPSKYDCQLCMVTYGPFGMKTDWKKFLNTLSMPAEFLHKDELHTQYPDLSLSLPAVVVLKNNKLEKIVLTGKDFEHIRSLDELKRALTEKLHKR